MAPDVEDRGGNLESTTTAIRDALDQSCDIVLLPELATSGYVFRSPQEARAAAETPDGASLTTWADTIRQTRPDAIVIGGFVELADDGELRNSIAIVTASGSACVYRKVHLWGSEKLIFKPGNDPPPVVETQHGRIGAAICYDAYFPEVSRGLALAGADLLALPTNAPLNTPGEPDPPASVVGDDSPVQVSIYVATAHVNGVFVAGCDRCGDERGVSWVGGSAIVDETGRVLAPPPADRGPGLLIADCVLERARQKRRGSRNDLLADRRVDVYPELGGRRSITRVSTNPNAFADRSGRRREE